MNVAGPTTAYLLPTGRCNLDCAGCYATLEQAGRHTKRGELTPDEYRAVIAELYGMGVRTFDISGGEPLLYPNLVGLCEEIRRHEGTRIWLVSNGTRFAGDQLRRLAPLVQRLVISLDAPEAALHDEMRGRAGTFSKALSTLRSARKLPFPEVAVNQLVCEKNAHTVAPMLALCSAEGIDRLSLLTYRDVSENGTSPEQVPPLEAQQRTWAAVAAHVAAHERPTSIDLVVPSFLRPEATAFRDSLGAEGRKRVTTFFPHLRGITAYRATVVVKPMGVLTGDTAMANDAHFDLGHVREGVGGLWAEKGAYWRQRLAEREALLRADGPCRACPRWHVCRGGCPAAARHQWGDELRHDRTCDAFRAAGVF
jgi:radical SAM protein with 4Fe4S-binding SPASM domain